jgi:hypothetical protein
VMVKGCAGAFVADRAYGEVPAPRMTKSLTLFWLAAIGVVGSWTGPSMQSTEPLDARPEALVTGLTLLMLATVLRHVAGGGRAK